MPKRVVRVRRADDGVAAAQLRTGVEKIQAELDARPGFPEAVQAAAERAADSPALPELDRTDLEMVTIDPEGAMDLDQAMHLERDGDGYLVHYAIADVAAFVEPGGPIDEETHRRGETLYGADSKVPLHPRAISEAAGSLLPDQVRPALLWTIRLDADADIIEAGVQKARVRSRAQLDYDAVQRQIDAGEGGEMFAVLQEIGERRIRLEQERGGISLPLPEQNVVIDGEQARLEFRSLHPVEEWNAQISLLTGMAAGEMMLEAKVGVLRTLPPVDPRDVERLRRTARGLGVEWPEGTDHVAFVRSLDPKVPAHAAMVVACTRLLRGSGYAAFNGELPEQTEHSAIAAVYAHCTAPLRRLVDRYAGEVCVALSAGQPVPDWVTERFETLPQTMGDSSRRANTYENAILNLLEAEVLKDRMGETFTGVIVEVEEPEEPDEDAEGEASRGEVTIAEPAIEARVVGTARLPLGERVQVTLTTADPVERRVEFTYEG